MLKIQNISLFRLNSRYKLISALGSPVPNRTLRRG